MRARGVDRCIVVRGVWFIFIIGSPWVMVWCLGAPGSASQGWKFIRRQAMNGPPPDGCSEVEADARIGCTVFARASA